MPSSCWAFQDMLAKEGRFRPTLPEICQELHELTSGSCDPDPTYERMAVWILETAVKDWKPSADHTKPYDDAVLALVKATLAERNN